MVALTEFGNMLPLEGAVPLFVAGNLSLENSSKPGNKWCWCPLGFLPSLPFPLVNLEDQGYLEDRGHLWVPKNKGTGTNQV